MDELYCKWKPLKVVCIISDSKGTRLKKLTKACNELDMQIAKIFNLKVNK